MSARPKSTEKISTKAKASPTAHKKPSAHNYSKGSTRVRDMEPPAARRQKKARREMLGNEKIDNRFEDDHNFMNTSRYVEEVN